MSRRNFTQYVHQIVTPDNGVRYVVAIHMTPGDYYYQYLSVGERRVTGYALRRVYDPTELPSYETRQQALRHARYLYGAGGQLARFYREFNAA